MNQNDTVNSIIKIIIALAAVAVGLFVLYYAFNFVLFLLPFLIPVAIGLVVVFISKRNTIISLRNNIERCKSEVNTTKAKYLAVQRNTVGITGKVQKNETDRYKELYEAEGEVLKNSNVNVSINQRPNVRGNFKETSTLVMELFTEFQRAQSNLNNAINDYNTYIQIFPNNIVANFMKAEPEKLIDSENLENASTLTMDEEVNFDDLV